MTLITTAALSRLQTAAQAVLADTAVIKRISDTTRNARGGEVDTWAPIATVPCCLIPWLGRKGGEEAIAEGLFQVAATYKVTLPANTDITEEDQITVGARLFDVKAVLRPGGWEVERECICIERLSA